MRISDWSSDVCSSDLGFHQPGLEPSSVVAHERGVSNGRVWPRLVVIFGPGRDHCAGMIEVEEQRLVQKLITHPAIEALDIAVLHRLAGRDIMPLDADLAAPCEHRVRCQLGRSEEHTSELQSLMRISYA